MRKFIYLVTLSALCTLVMTSCLRSGADTIILPELVLVDEVPDTVIPPAIREEFEEYMPIHEGKNPPYIQGQYVMNSMVLEYSSDGQFYPGRVFSDCYMAFLNQIKGQCSYRERQASGNTTSDKVYISGKGNDFTAYFVAHTVHDDGETTEVRSTLVSGTLTSEGIKDCKYAFIMLEKNDPYSKLMPVNAFRVFYDDTKLASITSWYDESNKAPRRSAPANGAEEIEPLGISMSNPLKQ